MSKLDTERLLRCYVIGSSAAILLLLVMVGYLTLSMREVKASTSYTEWNAAQACEKVASNCDTSHLLSN